MRYALALTMVVLLAPAAPVGAARLTEHRFAGRFKVTYQHPPSGAQRHVRWRLVPFCEFGPCSARVHSSGGLKGIFRYSRITGDYTLKRRFIVEDSTCGALRKAYVQNQTYEISRFRGDNYAVGRLYRIYRPTVRAQNYGCTRVFRRSGRITLHRL